MARKNMAINIMKVTTQNSIVDKFECKLTNRSLKCQSVLGLV